MLPSSLNEICFNQSSPSSDSNMHKSSVAASNYNKVTNHIPDDLEFSILSKLPLKSLKRFGSVSKLWSLLFENPIFMSMYRINFLSKNHAFYEGTSLLLHGLYYLDPPDAKNALYSISGDRFETRVRLDWPNPFQVDDDKGFCILGSYSINGILCLFRHPLRSQLMLWNPATKEFKVIPHSPIESNPHNWVGTVIFGYDRIRDDYKVIRHVEIRQPMGDKYCWWEIYSLRRNTWKKLDDGVPLSLYCCEQVFIDGVSHWLRKDRTPYEKFLVSFDFSNETFFTTPIPSNISNANFDFSLVSRDLMVLNGSVALFVCNTEKITFHISILGEVGVKNSWTKLFIFGLLPCFESTFAAWKNGVIFQRNDNGELVWFDLSTHMIKDILGDCNVSKIVIYKESLLPIGGVSD